MLFFESLHIKIEQKKQGLVIGVLFSTSVDFFPHFFLVLNMNTFVMIFYSSSS